MDNQRIELKVLEGQGPDCPDCGMGNTLLPEKVDGMSWLVCRDCGYHVPERERRREVKR